MSAAPEPADRAVCAAKGCDRPAMVRGLCTRHYRHLLEEKHLPLAGEVPDFTGQDDPSEAARHPVFVRMPAAPSDRSYVGCAAYIAVPAF